MKKYAIVGFGCAGYHAARALRRTDPNAELHVFEASDHAPANPMLTTYFISGKLTHQQMFPFGELAPIIQQLNIRYHGECPVAHVNAAKKELCLKNGERLCFDGVILATGARAIMPPIQGMPSEKVFLIRTVAEAEALNRRLSDAPVRRALVVGASMVGIKAVELLQNRGIETVLADLAPYLFPLVAFKNVAQEIERRIGKNGGLSFRWKTALSGYDGENAVFSDGSTLPVDLVCMCAGTRANAELVSNLEVIEGEPVRVNRGIVVDAEMQTSVPGIYAAGDCCEGVNLQSGETMIIGLWANAVQQGDVAGHNLAGGHTVYRGSVPHNITHFMDMDFIGMGDNRKTGEVITSGVLTSGTYIQATVSGDKLHCINILGNNQVSGTLKSYFLKKLTMRTGVDFSLAQRALLLREGVSASFIDRIGGQWND